MELLPEVLDCGSNLMTGVFGPIKCNDTSHLQKEDDDSSCKLANVVSFNPALLNNTILILIITINNY